MPSAGELTVAVARAVTVAGASTTSTTVARPTVATSIAGSPPPVQPASTIARHAAAGRERGTAGGDHAVIVGTWPTLPPGSRAGALPGVRTPR